MKQDVAGGPAGDVGKVLYLGAGWTAVSRMMIQLAQLLLILVAARHLSPAEFGVFALLSAVAAALTYGAEAGWRELIIIAGTREEKARAHTWALLGGTAFAALGLGASTLYLVLSRDVETALVMGVLSAWVLPGAASSAQAGILTRRGALVRLAQVQILGEAVGLTVGVACLIGGLGILSLAFSKMSTQLVVLAGSLLATRWARVSPIFRTGDGPLLAFSCRILLTRIVTFARGNLALFLIGAFFGPAGAGLYRAGGRFAASIAEIVGEPIRRVGWSLFGDTASPEQDQSHGMAKAEAFLAIAAIAAAPVFIGLALTSPGVVTVLLGEQWQAAAPILAILALAKLLTMPMYLSEPLLARHGRIDILQHVTLGGAALSVIALTALSPFGLIWAAASELLAATVLLPVLVWLHRRHGRFRWLNVLGTVGAALGLAVPAMAVSVLLIQGWTEPWSPALSLAAQVLGGAGSYGVVVGLTSARLVRKLRGLAPQGPAATPAGEPEVRASPAQGSAGRLIGRSELRGA